MAKPEKSVKVPAKVSGRPESVFAILNREKKALRLADLLARAGITAEEAERASEEDWQLAAEGAGTRMPSEQCRKMVIEMLRNRETTK